MWEHLHVIHSTSSDRGNRILKDHFLWKTCLRNIYIGDLRRISQTSSEVMKLPYNHQSYEGYTAYAFLLEVILGLHSELLGETEVFHQFRRAFHNDFLPSSHLGSYLKYLCRDLTTDARKVRKSYTGTLGELSYGGIARRLLKGKKHVIVFGTGQLACQLLPWLIKNHPNLRVVGRNSSMLTQIQQQFSVATCTYEQLQPSYFPRGSALVIVAPIDLKDYFQWLQKDLYILDFRETVEKSLAEGIAYCSLQDVLLQIRQSQIKRECLCQQLKPTLDEILYARKQVGYQFVHSWGSIAEFSP